ncbi:phosphotransferase [Candidatus Pelagibacter sp.]|nr:phosphotransferase [Candidatus Pelagibacter sp.]
MNFKNIVELSGDASHRKFYRDKKNNSIIVYAKKEKRKNLLIYAAINKLLNNNKILTPRLISEKYKKNYIIIEDLGDYTGLKKFKNYKIDNYIKLFEILKKLKLVRKRTINTFLKTNYTIKKYSNNELLREAKLFSDWYMPKIIKKKLSLSKKLYIKIIKKLILSLKLKKKVFVHRDFHISNIMIKKNKIYLIDSQDAVFGNEAYDLASLIDDVRIKIKLKNREKIYEKFISKQKKINPEKLRNDFEILSVLRNLKIIGIFTRLSKRDKKHKYLKLIPYAWKMIDERRKHNTRFEELNNFLSIYFQKI